MITEEQLQELKEGDPVRYGIFKNLKFTKTEGDYSEENEMRFKRVFKVETIEIGATCSKIAFDLITEEDRKKWDIIERVCLNEHFYRILPQEKVPSIKFLREIFPLLSLKEAKYLWEELHDNHINGRYWED